EVDGYPLYSIHLGDADRIPVLICAGIHGDEPAGPEAVQAFLRRDLGPLLEHFSFLILPCINPTGYAANRRETTAGIDLNRQFEKEASPEVQFVKQALNERRFAFVADFHEDWEATGFYMYEGRRDEQWVGPEIVNRVREMGEINGETSDNDLSISDGVFQVDPAWGTKGLTSFTYAFHSDHVVTSETPSDWPLEKRVAVQLTVLDTLLEDHKVVS
ncbi:MAG: M14 family metallocarboxypeptidase, partial [bacterium]|nr:M14 family metallocarboxypeptidase [bacterium]